MGRLANSATTQMGNFSGSSYSNYSVFRNMIDKWKRDEKIKYVKVSEDGLKVEAEWTNGDRRWADYTPHPEEDIRPLATGLKPEEKGMYL